MANELDPVKKALQEYRQARGIREPHAMAKLAKGLAYTIAFILAYLLAIALLHGGITLVSGGAAPEACQDCPDDEPPSTRWGQ